MKNNDVDSQPKFQAHMQFTHANAQPQIAKEFKTPSPTGKTKQRNANICNRCATLPFAK